MPEVGEALLRGWGGLAPVSSHPSQLLIMRAIIQVHWANRKAALPGSWLERMLTRKPRILVAIIALANRMARAIWAMATKQEEYCDPTLSVAA